MANENKSFCIIENIISRLKKANVFSTKSEANRKAAIIVVEELLSNITNDRLHNKYAKQILKQFDYYSIQDISKITGLSRSSLQTRIEDGQSVDYLMVNSRIYYFYKKS